MTARIHGSRIVTGGALCALLVAAPAASQPVPSTAPAMTLDEARRYALDHQPLVRSAMARLAARTREARIPRAQWMPQVGATAQLLGGTANNTTASYLNVPEVDLPRIGGTKNVTGLNLTPAASSLVAVTLDQEVYDFGRISAQITAADAGADEARADTDAVRLDVLLAVEEAFDSVLAGAQVLVASEDAWKRALAHRDYASAGVKSGMRPPVDLTRSEAELAQADVRRIRARSGLAMARSTLAAAIGSDAPAVDARALAPASAPASPGLAEALKLAHDRNPAVVAGLARIRARHATTQAIGREMLPNLFASATISGRAGGTAPSNGSDTPVGGGFLPDVVNWHVGLVLQWNLFDATVLARRDASEAREDEARADLDTATNNVVLAVERAYLDLDAAQQVIPGLSQAVSAAVANQAQADARFRAGLGTIVELADAETLLTGAQLELAIGRFAADRARAQLGRAIGAALDAVRPGGKPR